jgi:N-acetylneuraminate synthase
VKERAFSIAGRPVGGEAPCFVVAELSANHGHDLGRALRTIEAAAKAGVDAIKLQTYTPDTLTLRSDAKPFVVRTENAWAGRTLHDLYAEAMTPWEWHAELFACAAANGLVCFSTPFDVTAVELLESLGAPAHKIASFELVDLPLVEQVARRGKPVILSTGMAKLSEIEAALAACRSTGNDQLALLRCVSCYPAEPAAMGLRSLPVLAALGAVVGLSDHTRDHTAAIAAVALGAKLVEKHFTLSRALGGPDAFFSLEPDELGALVRAIRDAEAALGGPRFGPAPDELPSLAFRRSLFVARDVAAGQVLTCDDVRSVRPSDGLSPAHLPEVLGRRATRALTFAEPLAWSMVGDRPEGPAIVLRPATHDDADRLLAWRNDPTTRAASFSDAEVARPAHLAWLAATLASTARRLFVAELDGVPVGQARLDDRGGDGWEVSIAVAPEARGRGLAAQALRALEPHARALGAVRLIAQIRAENAPSIRMFKAAGYYGFVERAAALECERRLSPFAR